MKKFSKIFESQYFTQKDIETINDIILDMNENDDYQVHIDEVKSPGGVEKIEIWLLSKENSYEKDFLDKLSIFTSDIQNVISHLRSLGTVYHRIEIIQENRYFGGEYSEIYFKTKITLTV